MTRRLESLADRLPSKGAPLGLDLTEEVTTLEALNRLRTSCLRPKQGRPGFLIPALWVLTAVIITALVFTPVPRMQVEADVSCSAASFRVVDSVQLSGLSRLKLLQAVTVAPTQIEDPGSLQELGLTGPVEVRPTDKGSLTLGSLTIPSGSRVSLQRSADSGTWRFDLESARARILATVAGEVAVSAAQLPGRTIDFGRGASLVLESDRASRPRLEFYASPVDIGSFLADRVVAVQDLSFEEVVEEPAMGTLGLLRSQGSSVLAATVFIHSLPGRSTSLRKREAIELIPGDGRIRELRLEPAGLHVNFVGAVRDLRVGSQEALQTLRPSLLEWLAQHHAVRLAWGSAVWLSALLLGGIRWWNGLGSA